MPMLSCDKCGAGLQNFGPVCKKCASQPEELSTTAPNSASDAICANCMMQSTVDCVDCSHRVRVVDNYIPRNRHTLP